MPVREVYETGYSIREYRRKTAFWIIIATYCGLVIFGYLEKENPTVFFFSMILGVPATCFALSNLSTLIFGNTRSLITISPEGIRDIRLRPQFIPWSAIAAIEPSKPTLFEKISTVLFGTASIFSPYVMWRGEKYGSDRIDLKLRTPEHPQDALCSHLSIELKGLTISSERLASLIDAFREQYGEPAPIVEQAS